MDLTILRHGVGIVANEKGFTSCAFVEYLQRDGPSQYGRRNRDYPARTTGFERLRRCVTRLRSDPRLTSGAATPFRLLVVEHPHTEALLEALDQNPGPVDVIDILTEAEALRMATKIDCLSDEGCVTPELVGRLSVERRDLVVWAEELGF